MMQLTGSTPFSRLSFLIALAVLGPTLLLATSARTASTAVGTEAGRDVQAESAERRALQIAQEKALKKNSRLMSQFALRAENVLLQPRFATGDSWTVLAWPLKPQFEPNSENPIPVAFRFQVVAGDSEGRIIWDITQTSSPGALGREVDPQVKKARMILSRDGILQSKTYFMRSGEIRSASLQGLRTRSTAWEAFPLDPPRWSEAEISKKMDLSGIPAKVLLEIQHRSPSANTAEPRSMPEAFTQDDFFGRAVDFTWKAGSPWPALLRNSSGVSVLISSKRGTR